MQTKTSLTGNYVSHPSSVIYDDTIIGDGVYIGANCTIGSIAESKKYFYNPPSFKVIIGKETVIHGNVTIDAGTVSNTEIGNKVWLMKGCHIGHDVVVEDNVTISPHVCLGGHVVVGEGTNIGM